MYWFDALPNRPFRLLDLVGPDFKKFLARFETSWVQFNVKSGQFRANPTDNQDQARRT